MFWISRKCRHYVIYMTFMISFCISRRMKRTCTLCLFVINLATSTRSQCSGENRIIPGESGSAYAPNQKNARESCSWELNFPLRPTLLVLNVTQIKLFFEYTYWSWSRPYKREWCSQRLYINSGERDCDTKPFCVLYYADNSCLSAADSTDLEQCDVYQGTPVFISFTSSGESGFYRSRNYAEGFKMNYRYIDCVEDQTTTDVVTTQAQMTTTETPTTSPTHRRYYETSKSTEDIATLPMADITATQSNSSAPANTARNSDTGTVIVIVVSCFILVFLLAVILLVVLIRRRNRNKNQSSAQENEYQEFGDGSAEAAHSVAYVRDGQSNNAEQDTYHTIAAPDQSENNTYSRLNLDLVVGQSNGLTQEMHQSENTNAYSTLNLESQRHQSTSQNQYTMDQSESANAYSTLNLDPCTMDQSDGRIYSTISKEPQPRESNRAQKITVRYKVRQNSEEKQPSPEMVENVLYETR